MRNETIESFAQNLRNALGITTPVDLMQVVTDLHGQIVDIGADAKDKEAYIEPLNKYDDREPEHTLFEIGVSDSVSENRRRFSIAHEIGHLFLHLHLHEQETWNEKVEAKQVYHRYGSGIKENEAHSFAASLLMPEEEYRAVVEQHTNAGQVDIEKIAEYFQVSASAASNRGKWLGIFQW